jgi:5,10-methylenetetrahydrofolate reductase
MDEPIATASATLQRWLTGPHFTALPMRSASHPVPTPSFEFFPPRTEVLEQQRFVNRLATRFVSVTYGAGGTSQARTHATVARIVKETSLAHAAAYPEGHPGMSGPVADLENLKRKPDAGVTRAITQCFFDTSTYLRFFGLCLAAGIEAPIVPEIMPVSNFAQAVKFSDKCGAGVPARMGRLFEGTENDSGTRRMLGMVIAAEQVLQANRVDEFHFYTLNRSDLTYAIAHMLGIRASVDR